ncbi:MAG: glycerol-3-phosphate 1-O-acyltransferase PlsY [Lachnospiraceae bacterium]|nr:glycerol-3-phosphate 1-O-acyltransferase PlsY [Lachnospiraceae bacterium]
MERVICLAIGYCFGLLQTGYLYGKAHGIDIRDHGSGNAGTTNALRTLGKKAGLITFLGDAFKCVFAVLLVWFIFKDTKADIMPLLKLYTGAGVILGHNYPFYLKFRGGKGIAASGGMMLSFDWVIVGCALVTFLVAFLLTSYVSVGSLLIYVGFMIELVVMGQLGYFGVSQPILNEMYIIAAILTILAFYKHRANIKRLLKGEENKTILFKKK